MTDLYTVFGNPIAHSKSPAIHAEFARQTHQDLVYTTTLAPVDGFPASVRDFVAAGGRGANVTVPFKEEAYGLCTRRSERAQAAGAVNTLSFLDGQVVGDNTDGAGLVQDLLHNLRFPLRGRRILLMGAGGAARGGIAPLLAEEPAALDIVNRNMDRAAELCARFPAPDLPTDTPTGRPRLFALGYDALPGRKYDLVINATSASLSGELPPLPADLFADGALAYDMMYGRDTPFLAFARASDVRTADGLGMLVEQAAEAFRIWRGVRPLTAPIIRLLRSQ